MISFSYIIWNASPEIFTVPIPFIDLELTLRWYGLLFALGFLISQQILYYIFRKEGKPEKDVDTLTIYIVVATIIGARLGHVIFYGHEQFGPIWYLQHPLEILKIWEGGLASHGGAAGILFALWLYSRKKKPRQNYLQTLDRIVILVALTGALIRFGNVMNSEIIGKPTGSGYGIFFTRTTTSVLKSDGTLTRIQYVQNDSLDALSGTYPIKILAEFKPDATNKDLAAYVENNISNELTGNPHIKQHINQESTLDYSIRQDEKGNYFAIINTYAIPRHPAQLYESISCLLLFAFLLWLWTRHKEKLAEGRLFGVFLIVCFGLRIVWEFMKENQVDFEAGLPLNVGQLLSIPLALLGVFFLIRSYRKVEQ